MKGTRSGENEREREREKGREPENEREKEKVVGERNQSTQPSHPSSLIVYPLSFVLYFFLSFSFFCA